MSKAIAHTGKSGANVQHFGWNRHIVNYFASHLEAFRVSFRNLSLTPAATLMTMVAIGVCLSLPVGLFLFVKNIQQLSKGWDEGSAMTLYVNPKSTQNELNAITAKIKTFDGVEHISFLPQDKALREFQQMTGLNDILTLLPENPLPAVMSLKLNPDAFTRDELFAMRDELAKLPQVKQAALDYEWVEKLNVFLTFGKSLTQFLYFIIGIGVVLMVSNTIRLALERHREEIEVLSLVGATVAYIRRPFLYRGALYGVLGGIIAALILNGAVLALQGGAQQVASLYQGVFSLDNLHFTETMALLGASCALGWFGAAMAFTQQQRTLATE